MLFCHASALLRKVKVIDGSDGSSRIRLSRSSSILPTAVSRRRWLSIGHSLAGWRSAMIFTVLLSCRRQGINPQHYLTDVLDPPPLFSTLLASKLATAPAGDMKELMSLAPEIPPWPGAFLDYWCFRVVRSCVEPMSCC
jgi:hypothetical protein